MEKRLEDFYRNNNFKTDKNLCYGVYRNRVISITTGDRKYIATISFNGQLSRETGMELNEKMKEIKANNRILLNAITTNVFLELQFYYSNNAEEEMLRVIDLSLDAMAQLSFPTCEVCPICRQIVPTNAPFVRIKNQVLQAHEHCIDQLIGQFSSMENKMNSNDKKDIVKMTLICLLSVITTVGVMAMISTLGGFSYFSLLSGWMCFLIINIASIQFKIKNNTTRIVFMLVSAFVAIICSMYFGSVIDMYKQLSSNGATISYIFQNYFKIIASNFSTYGRNLLIDLILSFVLIGMSAFSGIRQIIVGKQKIKKL